MSERPADRATEAFLAHRNLLFTVAYEILGSAADAEDVLQETWLRWVEVEADGVRDERAYLVRITTRQALNRLRTVRRRRESYVGQWLPEPVLTTPDVAENVELAERMSMALLLVLETLAPTERVVFVLREVFEVGYEEIAEAVGKSPAAVRQIAHRARAHVAARRPRTTVSAREAEAALATFQRALQSWDLPALFEVLAPDVVMIGDGGGLVRTVPKPVVGAEKVVRLVAGAVARRGVRLSFRRVVVNGGPGFVVAVDGVFDGVMAVHLDNGLVAGLYYVRNPEKLTHMGEEITPALR
ncbi:MAG TPA: RNA polymerase sigma-70 factor [Nocardia sp.]|uniref:RNA polymerase sigma-70 factor n=1 Tax=Nocardia TaxID=1817 RepID=UPI002455F456|nr:MULTISPECIES: RNA polymerase sigma-70 factor [Nocardia]HLS78814.1 RNA polymerase sigma-70 factor [Nocardia sp.]